jgi:hypothetical protein
MAEGPGHRVILFSYRTTACTAIGPQSHQLHCFQDLLKAVIDQTWGNSVVPFQHQGDAVWCLSQVPENA